jgi:hypothetical protein
MDTEIKVRRTGRAGETKCRDGNTEVSSADEKGPWQKKEGNSTASERKEVGMPSPTSLPLPLSLSLSLSHISPADSHLSGWMDGWMDALLWPVDSYWVKRRPKCSTR